MPLIERNAFARYLLDKGFEQGFEQGYERGSKLGRKRQAWAVAQRMLLRGYELREIEQVTGLSPEDIRQQSTFLSMS